MAYLGRTPIIGRYVKIDDIGSSFNGSLTTFNLTSGGDAVVVQAETQIIVSLAGAIKEPITDYTVSGSQITFASAPANGVAFFATVLGDTHNVGVPLANTLENTHIKSDAAIAMSKLDGSSGSLSALTVDNVIVNGSKVRIGAGATGSLGGNLEVSTGSTGAIATFAGASADELYVTNRSAGIVGFTTNSADSFEVKSNTTQFIDQSNASIATFTSATSTFAGDVAINGADLFVGNSSSLPSNSDIYMYGATDGTGHIFFNDGSNAGSIEYNHATNAMKFGVTSDTPVLTLLSDTNATFANWLGVGVNPPARTIHAKGGTDTRIRSEESSGTLMDMTVINTGHFLDSVGAVPFTINKHTCLLYTSDAADE